MIKKDMNSDRKAVWLIVKGFNPSAISSGSAKVDMS